MPFEQTENEIRYRVREPNLFVENSFRSKEIEDGIRLILGKLKANPESLIIQAIRFSLEKWDMEKAKQWVEDHKDKFEMNEKLKSINSVEIFSAGEWNGDKYSTEDLDEMVKAFKATEGGFKPSLKLGHDESQKLPQKDGLPSIGYVHNLRRVGEKLVADFKDIPNKIYELIKNKAYSRVSSEIYWNIKYGEHKFKRMLCAVSLLGQDMPAVNNLREIMGLYTHDDMVLNKVYSEQEHYDKIEQYEYNSGESMPKELEEKLNETTKLYNQEKTNSLKLQEEKTELEKKYSQSEEEKQKLIKENQEKEQKLAEYKQNEIKLENENYIKDLEKEGLTSPKLNEYVMNLISDKKEYSIGEKTLSKKDLVKETLKLAKEVYSVNLDENSEVGENGKTDDEKQIEKYMQENKCDYRTAYTAVLGNKN